MAVEPVAERIGHAVVVHQHLADVALAQQQAQQAFGCIAEAFDGALRDGMHRQRGQRRFFRRLPHHRVAAHQRERRVPRPHGHGKVEGRDHAAHAQRMPGFHHAVLGALGGQREAVELARQADREVADVDHFLHFARAFGRDLAGLQRDEAAQVALGARSSSPSSRTSSPRRGAGTLRQALKAAWARPMVPVASAAVVWRTCATTSPETGERTASSPPVCASRGTPRRCSSCSTSVATEGEVVWLRTWTRSGEEVKERRQTGSAQAGQYQRIRAIA
jgi:hypothetical protein